MYATAKSVIVEAYERGISTDEVLAERYPCGPGGVGHAQRRMKAETKQRIREWLEPGEPIEPNGMRA